METQGDFVRTLASEVRDATFANIEDIVAFVTWLDEELSFLVSARSFFRSENVSLINQEAGNPCIHAWYLIAGSSKNALHLHSSGG